MEEKYFEISVIKNNSLVATYIFCSLTESKEYVKSEDKFYTKNQNCMLIEFDLC